MRRCTALAIYGMRDKTQCPNQPLQHSAARSFTSVGGAQDQQFSGEKNLGKLSTGAVEWACMTRVDNYGIHAITERLSIKYYFPVTWGKSL